MTVILLYVMVLLIAGIYGSYRTIGLDTSLVGSELFSPICGGIMLLQSDNLPELENSNWRPSNN